MTDNNNHLTSPQDLTLEFHKIYDQAIRKTPIYNVAELLMRGNIILEEAEELHESYNKHASIVDISDALGDLVYVCYGAAHTHGLNLDASFKSEAGHSPTAILLEMFIREGNEPSPVPTAYAKDGKIVVEAIKSLATKYNLYVNETLRSDGDISAINQMLVSLVSGAYYASFVFGVPLDEVLQEIQKSNLSKLDDNGKPIKRDDGKVLKGPNFFKPEKNIAKLLLASGAARSEIDGMYSPEETVTTNSDFLLGESIETPATETFSTDQFRKVERVEVESKEEEYSESTESVTSIDDLTVEEELLSEDVEIYDLVALEDIEGDAEEEDDNLPIENISFEEGYNEHIAEVVEEELDIADEDDVVEVVVEQKIGDEKLRIHETEKESDEYLDGPVVEEKYGDDRLLHADTVDEEDTVEPVVEHKLEDDISTAELLEVEAAQRGELDIADEVINLADEVETIEINISESNDEDLPYEEEIDSISENIDPEPGLTKAVDIEAISELPTEAIEIIENEKEADSVSAEESLAETVEPVEPEVEVEVEDESSKFEEEEPDFDTLFKRK